MTVLLALICAELSVLLAPAQGCAICQTVLPQANEPLARGMFWSVLFLLSAPFAVGAVIGGWLLYQYRRANHTHRPELAVVVRRPTLISRRENA
ncbi:MAG TPA: hypothetical protein VNN62_24340 [Methylomirabilota bacterium]|jgi:predicted Na+-dependent transporter|nr:hypothetical protein [Methylomirabilota bacterium]